MWGNMMGWGGGAMFGVSHLLWWAFLIVGVVLLVGWLLRGAPAGDGGGRDRALAILKERYARGEIDKTEFEERRRDLT